MIIKMQNKFKRKMDGDFPGGSVAKTPYSCALNAGGLGSIPGRELDPTCCNGRFHMPQ